MFTKTNSTIAFAVALMSMLFGWDSTVSAGRYHDHIDRVAQRIERKSERLLRETDHYRHTPEYRRLVSDVILLRNTATHIHDVTHFEGNIPQLKRDVAIIEQTFHHVEGLFDHIERAAAYGHGQIRGNTRHVKNLLNQIEREIDHLADDLARICAANHGPAPAHVGSRYGVNQFTSIPFNRYASAQFNRLDQFDRYDINRNARCAANRNRGGLGFSIGGGSSKIWIGF